MPRTTAIALLLTGLCSAPSPAATNERIGETASVSITGSAPDGGAGQSWIWTHALNHPDATFIKTHLAQLRLGRNDALRVLDGRGRVIAEYSNRREEAPGLWLPSVPGDMAVIELHGTTPDAALTIDRYGYGIAQPSPLSICGGDQMENPSCYAGAPIETASRAVGRMIFEDGGALFACTGFLISAFDHFLSAGHCVASQAAVNSLEVTFGFANGSCDGKAPPTPQTFVGDRLLMTSIPFDVSLMTLAGGPAAIFGFLPLSSREPALGEPLYLPQHPDGGLQMVSVTDCRVSSPHVDGGAPGSDFGHTCDTEPGSSGSPVLDLDNQVVGLHHVGGCASQDGENLAVQMSRIVPLLPPVGSTLAVKGARVVRTEGFLALGGVVALGLGSQGLDPLSVSLALTLSDADGPFYSATVPPGALRQVGGDYLFTDRTGMVADGLRNLRLTPRGHGSFAVTATARAADLGGADREQVTVVLQMGTDVARQTIRMRRTPTALLFP